MSAPNISVTLPVGQAMDRVKLLLFQPFDLRKWFAIGFCAWLALLGEGGGGGGGGGHYNAGTPNGADMHRELERAWRFVVENLYWILPLAIAIVVLAIVLGLVFMWLGSRVKFMFLNCVALNRADIAEPWSRYSRQGNSLFLFRVVLSLIGLVLVLPAIGAIVFLIFQMASHGLIRVGAVFGIAGLCLWFIAIAIVLALIRKFTMDFVVPMMFLRGVRTMEAWREFRALLAANAGHFALYILFYIVLQIVISIIIFAIVILTCCCAGCLFAIPYLGTVLLLPVLVFQRAYSLHYLAQYGPLLNVFPPPTTPAA